ncbi:hypothetical protein ACIP2X_06385 [Streptomyces sp. NPDC089424]|uniref:hypothetical protein n=1 Tax=Streptomyces sp. NPDC089424 TaxID=3365917 RepID=UPI00380C4286
MAAICGGVLLNRMLLGHTALSGPEVERLIPYLHSALDAVAKEPEPAGEETADRAE